MSKKYTKGEIEEMIGTLHEQLIEINSAEKTAQKLDKNIKIECDICGGKYVKSNLSHHRKTMKHKREVEHLRSLQRLIKSKKMEGR